jgi:hypothetical protein
VITRVGKYEVDVQLGPDGTPTGAAIRDPSGLVDHRRLSELASIAAGRVAMARLATRLFGHTCNSNSKDGLMRCGQSWWEHTYKHVTTDLDATKLYAEFCEKQGNPFLAMAGNAPDCIIYIGAARWADVGFPTITMGERLAAAFCGTDIPEEWFDDITAPWKAFVIELPQSETPIFTVYDPEYDERVRCTRVLVHNMVNEETGLSEWWWTVFSEKEQHLWRQGTVGAILKPVQFREQETDRYKIHSGQEAFGEHVAQDERIYLAISRLVFNTILTLTDPQRVRPVGSSHKRYAAKGQERGHKGPPEQRVFVIGTPIQIDLRDRLRDYLAGRKGASWKLTTQIPVHGYWRWQPYGPRHSLRRRQFIEPYWKGQEDAVIPIREHHLEGRDEPADP